MVDLLVTPRLVVRRFVLDDWRALRAYVAKPEVTALDSPYPTDDKGAADLTALFAASDDFLAVSLRQAGALIGHLHWGVRDDRPPWRNLGFVFDSACWGQGLAHEAASALINHAFGQIEFPGFVTGTRPDNARALQLLARLGFTRAVVRSDGWTFELTCDDWGRTRSFSEDADR